MIDIYKNSIISIKNIEIDRLSITLKQLNTNIGKKPSNSSSVLNMHEQEENMDEIDNHLNHICHDLTEDLDNESLDQICYDLKAVPRKKKSNS
jgi:hypothetical protein